MSRCGECKLGCNKTGIFYCEENLGYEQCIDRLQDALYSADRQQGKWICHEGGWKNFDYYPTEYECDQCHHYVDVASDKNFCPYCGADMREREGE